MIIGHRSGRAEKKFRSLTKLLFQKLKDAIVSGKLEPGEPLSETFSIIKFVIPDCATEGRQLKTPLLALRMAPVGASSKVKVRTCGGTSRSVATLVKVTRTPALTTLLEIELSSGGSFTSRTVT